MLKEKNSKLTIRTINLEDDLIQKISALAIKDKRNFSNWCNVQLTKVVESKGTLKRKCAR